MRLIKKLNLRVLLHLASMKGLKELTWIHLCYFDARIVQFSVGSFHMQLTAVHLVDAHLCSDPGKYVSALLLSLSTMLHLELPHVNVLSKIDLIENYGKLGVVLSVSLLLVCLVWNIRYCHELLSATFPHQSITLRMLQLLISSTIRMCKICHIYSMLWVRTLVLLSTGLNSSWINDANYVHCYFWLSFLSFSIVTSPCHLLPHYNAYTKCYEICQWQCHPVCPETALRCKWTIFGFGRCTALDFNLPYLVSEVKRKRIC